MENILDTLKAIADAVAEAVGLIPDPERGRDVEMGADGTPTLEVDKVAENTVLDYIVRNGVPLNVLSEEIGYVDNGFEDTLVLDPIDGTSNAVAGVPMYTVSMAVGRERLSDIRVAYLRNIVTGESMWAEKGKGAFKDGRRMRVREMDEDSLFMMIYLGKEADPSAFELARRVKSSRSYGCASLEMALVAEGRADGFYMNSKSYPRAIRVVDIAASYLLLREAGGRVFDLSGEEMDMPFNLETKSNFLAVADPTLFDFVMKRRVGDRYGGRVFGLVANPNVPNVKRYAERVVRSLEGEKILFDKSAGDILGEPGMEICDMWVDVMITIGGDGTILRTLMNNSAPVVGINAGGVGFLAEVSVDDIEEGMERLRRGDYDVDERFKLDSSSDGEMYETAVNEAVVHTDSVAKIRQFKVYVDDKLATEVRADGIIVSTSTGSTGYAMSLGAPLVDPRVNCFLIVPMAAYKFASRPFVVPSDSKVTIECVLEKGCLLVIDGQAEHSIDGGAKVDFVRSSEKARFISFRHDFYSRVREKLVNAI